MMVIGLVTFAFLGVGYSILSEKLMINGKIKIIGKPDNPNIPDKKELEVTFSDNSSTLGTYQYGLTLKNTTTIASKAWTIYLFVPSDTEVVNVSGCTFELKDGLLVLKSLSWNGEIKAGGTVNWIAIITIKTAKTLQLPLEYASEIS